MLPEFIFHHIGVAVNDIDSSAKYYIEAGYTKTETTNDPVQNVNICFLTKDGMPTVELLSAVDENSPMVKFLNRGGVSPYHTCYQVSDIDDAIRKLKKMRFMPLSKPVTACALDDNKICFLYNKDVGLIELLEEK